MANAGNFLGASMLWIAAHASYYWNKLHENDNLEKIAFVLWVLLVIGMIIWDFGGFSKIYYQKKYPW